MKTEILKVSGMSCSGCTSNVTRALEAISGVSQVSISLDTGEATVQYDEGLTDTEQLKISVEEAGYSVSGSGPGGKGSCCCG